MFSLWYIFCIYNEATGGFEREEEGAAEEGYGGTFDPTTRGQNKALQRSRWKKSDSRRSSKYTDADADAAELRSRVKQRNFSRKTLHQEQFGLRQQDYNDNELDSFVADMNSFSVDSLDGADQRTKHKRKSVRDRVLVSSKSSPRHNASTETVEPDMTVFNYDSQIADIALEIAQLDNEFYSYSPKVVAPNVSQVDYDKNYFRNDSKKDYQETYDRRPVEYSFDSEKIGRKRFSQTPHQDEMPLEMYPPTDERESYEKQSRNIESIFVRDTYQADESSNGYPSAYDEIITYQKDDLKFFDQLKQDQDLKMYLENLPREDIHMMPLDDKPTDKDKYTTSYYRPSVSEKSRYRILPPQVPTAGDLSKVRHREGNVKSNLTQHDEKRHEFGGTYRARNSRLTTDNYPRISQRGLKPPRQTHPGCIYVNSGSYSKNKSYSKFPEQGRYSKHVCEKCALKSDGKQCYPQFEDQGSYSKSEGQEIYLKSNGQGSHLKSDCQAGSSKLDDQQSYLKSDGQGGYSKLDDQQSYLKSDGQGGYSQSDDHQSDLKSVDQRTYYKASRDRGSYSKSGNQGSKDQGSKDRGSYSKSGNQGSNAKFDSQRNYTQSDEHKSYIQRGKSQMKKDGYQQKYSQMQKNTKDDQNIIYKKVAVSKENNIRPKSYPQTSKQRAHRSKVSKVSPQKTQPNSYVQTSNQKSNQILSNRNVSQRARSQPTSKHHEFRSQANVKLLNFRGSENQQKHPPQGESLQQGTKKLNYEKIVDQKTVYKKVNGEQRQSQNIHNQAITSKKLEEPSMKNRRVGVETVDGKQQKSYSQKPKVCGLKCTQTRQKVSDVQPYQIQSMESIENYYTYDDKLYHKSNYYQMYNNYEQVPANYDELGLYQKPNIPEYTEYPHDNLQEPVDYQQIYGDHCYYLVTPSPPVTNTPMTNPKEVDPWDTYPSDINYKENIFEPPYVKKETYITYDQFPEDKFKNTPYKYTLEHSHSEILRNWLLTQGLQEFMKDVSTKLKVSQEQVKKEYEKSLHEWLLKINLRFILEEMSTEFKGSLRTGLPVKQNAELIRKWFITEGFRKMIQEIYKQKKQGLKNKPLTQRKMLELVKKWLNTPGVKSMYGGSGIDVRHTNIQVPSELTPKASEADIPVFVKSWLYNEFEKEYFWTFSSTDYPADALEDEIKYLSEQTKQQLPMTGNIKNPNNPPLNFCNDSTYIHR